MNGAVSFLGRKRRPLLVVDEQVFVAAWRTDLDPSNGGGEPHVVHMMTGAPIALTGVTGIKASENAVRQSRYFVLEREDDLPAAVVGAPHVRSIRHGRLDLQSPTALISLTVTSQADGRLVVFGVDATIEAPAPNVVHRTEGSDGSWGDWDVLEGGRLTDVSAEVGSDGRVWVFGCDASAASNNIFQCVQSAPNGAWDRQWTSLQGILTSVSVARRPDGQLRLVGANAGIAGSGPNTFAATIPPLGFQNSPAPVTWSGIDLRASVVSAATQPDGKLVVLGAGSLSGWGDNVSIARDGMPVEEVAERFSSVAVVRRTDGRLHFFGGDGSRSWRTTESRQSTASGAWGPWHPMDIRLEHVAATSGSDGRVHVVGLHTANRQAYEIVIRSELTPGGERTGWRPLDDGVLR